jgi:hypothetical protein
MSRTEMADDGKVRCAWIRDPLMRVYHDTE